MTRESCQNYLLNLDCKELLASMAKSEIFEISHNAKMVLSSISRYLPPEYQSSFKLKAEELVEMLRSLKIVLERGVCEGELFLSALELIQSFKFFIQFEPNRQIMAYSPVYKSITYILLNGDVTEKKTASELLWKLVTKPMSETTVVIATDKTMTVKHMEELNPYEFLSEPDILSFILENYPEILGVLAELSTQTTESQSIVFSCTLLVLMSGSEEIIGKGT